MNIVKMDKYYEVHGSMRVCISAISPECREDVAEIAKERVQYSSSYQN